MTTRTAEYLDAFHDLTGLRLRAVLEEDGDTYVLHDSLEEDAGPPVEATWTLEPDHARVRLLVALSGSDESGLWIPLLEETVRRLLAVEREARFFSEELAERYEEITLLTSVSEILGSIIHLERAASEALERTVEVLETDSAELWVAEPDSTALTLFAATGEGAPEPRRIPLEADGNPLARVFLDERPVLTRDGRDDGRTEEAPFIAVPVRHAALHGPSRCVGVLALRGRRERRAFSQADARIIKAIGSHLAATIENRRLVRESLEQERMLVELELAHDLQLKLLPELSDFGALADVAARCEPAESVGGDFYHFFRLPGERLGVMLGDVSSHGYSAGLIMALTMSTASIVVREREQPGEVLRGIHRELVRKLESTEMYMTLCYAVIDPRLGLLRYANAGHPHAYRIGTEGTVRLEALNPPLGIAEFDDYSQRDMEWQPGQDTLLMFTDGVSECLRADRMWSDDQLTEIARQGSTAGAREVLDRLFELACAPGGVAADDRTALVVK